MLKTFCLAKFAKFLGYYILVSFPCIALKSVIFSTSYLKCGCTFSHYRRPNPSEKEHEHYSSQMIPAKPAASRTSYNQVKLSQERKLNCFFFNVKFAVNSKLKDRY